MNSIEERAARYIEKMPPAVQGEGGSTAAFKVSYMLVQGFAMEPVAAATEFKTHFNTRCVPPFSDAEILRKCHDALEKTPRDGRGFLLVGNKKSHRPYIPKPPKPKPKRKLHVANERQPAVLECIAIARSRDLPGPGAIVAGLIGTLRVGELFGHAVYGISDANGPLSAVRRVDGKPFKSRDGSDPVKSLSLVAGSQFHRPYGFFSGSQIQGIALCEGAPDYLSLFEQCVINSSIDSGRLDDIAHIKEHLSCAPLMMLSATSRLKPSCSYIGDFRDMDVLLVPHADKAGIAGAGGWFNAIKPVAMSLSVFDCSKVRGNLGDDFNDVFNHLTESLLPC